MSKPEIYRSDEDWGRGNGRINPEATNNPYKGVADSKKVQRIDFGVMPVITLYQPWASWIIRGWKTIETRTHARFKSLKGRRILIHAGKTTDKSDIALHNPYLSASQIAHRPSHYVNGCIIGSALVYDCRWLDERDSKHALIECFFENRYGLFLTEVLVFSEPIKESGERGIWYYDISKKKRALK